jgi:hypothetical protein
MKLRITLAIVIAIAMLAMGCRDAEIASYNLSYAADNFELDRRIVFYNGITGEYLLVVKGRCSVEDSGRTLAVTCKTGDESFVKHYLGLSDNVTYFSEQLQGVNVSTYHYSVIFKPSVIIPDIEIK